MNLENLLITLLVTDLILMSVIIVLLYIISINSSDILKIISKKIKDQENKSC